MFGNEINEKTLEINNLYIDSLENETTNETMQPNLEKIDENQVKTGIKVDH